MVLGLDPSSSDSYLCEAPPPINARSPSGSGARACLARLSASASCPLLSNIAASHKIAPESRQLRYTPVRVRRDESLIGFVRMLSMKRWSCLPTNDDGPERLASNALLGLINSSHGSLSRFRLAVTNCGSRGLRTPTRNSQSPPGSDNMGVLCAHQGLSCSTF